MDECVGGWMDWWVGEERADGQGSGWMDGWIHG
jgi:hypothetical protein